jgi:hypothetical protein
MSERSLFQSLKMVVSTTADAVAEVANATNVTAQIGTALADTGLVMAESNKELVGIETKAKNALRKKELAAQYNDAFDEV